MSDANALFKTAAFSYEIEKSIWPTEIATICLPSPTEISRLFILHRKENDV